jgi:hypothetical protein
VSASAIGVACVIDSGVRSAIGASGNARGCAHAQPPPWRLRYGLGA